MPPPADHTGNKQTVGFAEDQPEGVGIQNLELNRLTAPSRPLGQDRHDVLVENNILNTIPYIFGSHWRPVGPFQAATDTQGEYGGFLILLPILKHPRLHRTAHPFINRYAGFRHLFQ